MHRVGRRVCLTQWRRCSPPRAGLGRRRDKRQSGAWFPTCPRGWRACPNRFCLGEERDSLLSVTVQANKTQNAERRKHLRFSPMSCMVRMMGLSLLGTPFIVQWILPYGVSTSCSYRCREEEYTTQVETNVKECLPHRVRCLVSTSKFYFPPHFSYFQTQKRQSGCYNPTNPIKSTMRTQSPSTYADFNLSNDHFHIRILQNHVY